MGVGRNEEENLSSIAENRLDLATLGLVVNATGAIIALNNFSVASGRAGRAAAATRAQAIRLNSALAGLGLAFGTVKLAQDADHWVLISSRIKLVTDSTEEHAAALHELFRISNETRNDLSASAALYQRMAIVSDELGVSQRDILNVIESVNNGLLVSGATAVEAAQSVRQLAQALGAGVLNGDEFRTVMEAMPSVAQAIAKEMGVSTGQLRDLAEAQKITADTVVRALLKVREELKAQAEQIPMTIGQGWTIFNNLLTRFVGTMAMATQATDKIAGALIWMGQNLSRITSAILAVVAGLVAYNAVVLTAGVRTAVMTAVGTVTAFFQLAAGIRSAAAAMALLSMVSRGVVGTIVGVGVATAAFFGAKKIFDELSAEAEDFLKGMEELEEKGKRGAAAMTDEQRKLLEKIAEQRLANADLIRDAQQRIELALREGTAQKLLSIEFERQNKLTEARREWAAGSAILAETEAAINLEAEYNGQAVRIEAAMEERAAALAERLRILKQFAENLQRTFADIFAEILNNGIKSFSDLFNGVKQLFLRMVSELAAARMMETVGQRFAGALFGAFGNAPPEKMIPASIKTGKGGMLPVEIQGVTATAGKSWAGHVAQALGPLMAGFAAGGIIGNMTTNRALGAAGGGVGGGIAGAGMASAMGLSGPYGMALGAVAGVIGGFMASSAKLAEEMRIQRETLRANNVALEKLRESIEGANPRRFIDALSTIDRIQRGLGGTSGLLSQNRFDPKDIEFLTRIASEVGITIIDEKGRVIVKALEQLREAIELTVRAMTTFVNTFDDQKRRLDAYNKIFDIAESPSQRLNDTYSILQKLAPDLMRQMGLSNLNLDTEAGRNVLIEGLRDIFNLIDSGGLTPELLGAFTDKNQLLDAILATKDGLNAFKNALTEATTDVPKAINLALYEQMNATSRLADRLADTMTGVGGGTTSPGSRRPVPPVNIGTVVNNSGDTVEVLADKMQQAAELMLDQGGYLYLPGARVEE